MFLFIKTIDGIEEVKREVENTQDVLDEIDYIKSLNENDPLDFSEINMKLFYLKTSKLFYEVTYRYDEDLNIIEKELETYHLLKLKKISTLNLFESLNSYKEEFYFKYLDNLNNGLTDCLQDHFNVLIKFDVKDIHFNAIIDAFNRLMKTEFNVEIDKKIIDNFDFNNEYLNISEDMKFSVVAKDKTDLSTYDGICFNVNYLYFISLEEKT